MYGIRPFTEADRAAVTGMGVEIIDWWDRHIALHRVVGTPAVAHLQVVDRGSTPICRPGSLEMRLFVSPEHRRRGIGSRLFERTLAFAAERQAESIRASYVEHSPQEPASFFLRERGFAELQRYCPSLLDLSRCDLRPFQDVERRLVERGARFFTFAEVPDTAENRRRLYVLDQEARSLLPYWDPESPTPQPFDSWLEELEKSDFATLELAEVGGHWVGICTSVTWGFTGVVPAYRGRGIATALKVRAIRSARERGLQVLETENRGQNAAMLAINRKLGYQFGVQEVECIKRLR